ncbi:DinB family protein [Flagellimonas allohymeniacidonis]|uniref:DinB family protein n=1 Tax=Flagellimonas allohymeniacidonis TaxID=2517819 RepID=A0A4Q8QDI4_9FLAO|nr:DinB family protein [Allomuricauda hymeniacidonis]TAI47774.1 DinB family protein [Allomuricauda hymeniacidonis]
MEKQFDILLKNRTILRYYLQNLTKDELFRIPKGFNNNIWWNIAHVVVTTQVLTYGFSGLDYIMEEELVEKYRKGTSPEGEPSLDEVKRIEDGLFSTLQTMETDYQEGKFSGFKEYLTSPKVLLRTVEDAISFSVFHDGLHLGTILALRKAIAQENH